MPIDRSIIQGEEYSTSNSIGLGSESIANGFNESVTSTLGRTYEYHDQNINQTLIEQQQDYSTQRESYDPYIQSTASEKATYRDLVKSGQVSMGDNGELVYRNESVKNMFDPAIMKGAYLSQNITDDTLDSYYQSTVQGEMDLHKSKGYTTGGEIGRIIGNIGAWFTDPESAVEFVTPGRILGKSIWKNMGKAFGVESLAAGASEAIKQYKPYGIIDHKRRANIKDEVSQATESILWNAGLAGVARMAGSGIEDKFFNGLVKDLPIEDALIVTQWQQGQKWKLINDVEAHNTVLRQVSDDLDNGKPIDIKTDIDIETRTSPDVESVNMREEQNNHFNEQGYADDEVDLNKAVDDSVDINIKEDEDDLFIVENMEKIDNFPDDAELIALKKQFDELSQLETTPEEIIAMEESMPKTQGFQTKEMQVGNEVVNKTDFDLIKSYKEKSRWNRENPDSKKAISLEEEEAHRARPQMSDDLQDIDFKESEKAVFNKFGDNLAAGTIAGVETDEQGNVTLDPAKFVAGLGGYTALKSLYRVGAFDNLPQEVNKMVKKHFGVNLDTRIVDDGIDYKMDHSAPEPEGANSGSDISDVFPDSPSDKNFERYYGTGDKIADQQSISVMKQMENNPEKEITIYRAAPVGKEINDGDWITLSKKYATDHGERHLDHLDAFDIIEKKVKAKDVFTNGDSINEWGYYPQDTGARTIDDITEYFKQVGKDLELKTFFVFETPKGDLRLDTLVVPKEMQKIGKGTKAMEELTKIADTQSKLITLTPALTDKIHGTTSRSRLVKFYKKFGFVENKGRNKDFSISDGMYRIPKEEETK